MKRNIDWIAVASESVDRTDTTTTISLGVLGAIVGFTTINPIVGTAIGAYALWKAWYDEGKNGEAEEFLQNYEFIAPFLNKKQLYLYVCDCGEEKALEEIKEAITHDIEITSAARQFARACGVDLKPYRWLTRKQRDRTVNEASEPSSEPTANDDEPRSTSADASGETVEDKYVWMSDLLEYPSVLIYGPQGSGKSVFARWLVATRASRGHQVEIYDPHREAGDWEQYSCFGDGMDYDAIDTRLLAFSQTVRRRYEQRAQQRGLEFQPLTVVAEEFTRWGTKCDNAADFFETAVTDIRKVACHALFVSHNRTMGALGGAKGLAATRDAAMLELELQATIDPVTGKASPAFRGKLKYPGGETIDVEIPQFKVDAPPSEPSSNGSSEHPNANPSSELSSGTVQRPNPPSDRESTEFENVPELLRNLSETELRALWERVRETERSECQSAAVKAHLGRGAKYQAGKAAYEWLADRFGKDGEASNGDSDSIPPSA
ncbi:MAG: hypothetical protein J7642_21245 [Cyanobacteria bacterium SBC]|nr:hypothetical protein [Cyanobacteria bacterium SBC]